MPAERKDKEINGNTYSILLAAPSQCMNLVNESAILAGMSAGAKDAFIMKTFKISKLSFNDEPIFEPASFDKHFDNHRADLFPVFEWAMEEQITPFLSESERNAYIQMKKLKEEMASQSLKAGQ